MTAFRSAVAVLALIAVGTMVGCAAATQTSPDVTGDVNSPRQRDDAEQVGNGVPNVQQVVNDLQVKNQRARSSK